MMGAAGMQSPTSYFPPAPTGGLGGLGGFINSRQGGDVLQALGMSLMGSPRNAPLQDFGKNLMALQDRTRGSEKEAAAQAQAAEQRQALISAAVAYGVPQAEAQSLSANPAALKIRMEQIAAEKAATQRNEYISRLGTPGSFEMPAAPGGQAAAPQGGTDSWGALGAQYGWQAPTQGEATGDFIEPRQAATEGRQSRPDLPATARQGEIRQGPDGQSYQYIQTSGDVGGNGSWGWRRVNLGASGQSGEPQQVAQAAPAPQQSTPQAAPQFSTQNPNVDNFMRQRRFYVQQMAAAPDEASRKVLENYIGQIDTMLKQYEPTAGQRDYQFDQQQRQQMGLPAQPFSEWDAEQAARRRPETKVNVNTGETSPGWKKIDEGFADTYLSWNSGGFADSMKQVEQLGEAIKILESGENVTGTIGLLPDQVRPFFNEQGTIARENVEEVVQRSLREILGAQFTEKEGERLIARAFNPLLKPAENAKRVRRLMNTIVSMGDAKQDMVNYFDEHGTLKGYRGSRPTLAEVQRLADDFGESPEEGEGNASGAGTTSTGVPWSIE